MDVRIDFTKSAQENAEDYFLMSKKAKKKAEGAEKSAAEMRKALENIKAIAPKTKEMKKLREKKWYEKFNWFFTSNSMLAIGGRSAQQNELINSRFFEQNDMFFHADVFGASVVILKEGIKADRDTWQEVAQFAACHSNAWENGEAATNVYALGREQISKSTGKGSLGTGSFLMKGDREWFKGTTLELYASPTEIDGQKLVIIEPMLTAMKRGITNGIVIKPGNVKKSDAAKKIAKKFGCTDIDYVMQHLPAGSFSIK